MTASRVNGVVYTNSTNKPIAVSVCGPMTAHHGAVTIYVDGLLVVYAAVGNDGTGRGSAMAIVPAGASYSASTSPTFSSAGYWTELR